MHAASRSLFRLCVHACMASLGFNNAGLPCGPMCLAETPARSRFLRPAERQWLQARQDRATQTAVDNAKTGASTNPWGERAQLPSVNTHKPPQCVLPNAATMYACSRMSCVRTRYLTLLCMRCSRPGELAAVGPQPWLVPCGGQHLWHPLLGAPAPGRHLCEHTLPHFLIGLHCMLIQMLYLNTACTMAADGPLHLERHSKHHASSDSQGSGELQEVAPRHAGWHCLRPLPSGI